MREGSNAGCQLSAGSRACSSRWAQGRAGAGSAIGPCATRRNYAFTEWGSL